MDSPESSKPSTITTAVESVPAQESPVFSYISNLSPIQPFKAPPVIQGFPGLNSPPLVFTSPRLKPHSQTTYLKRTKFPELSTSKLSGHDEDCKNSVTFVDGSGKLDTQLSTGLVNCTEDSDSPVNDQTESPTGHPDQFLADVLNMDSVDPNASSNSDIKSECTDQPPDDLTGKEFVVKLDYKQNTSISEEMETVANPAISWLTQEVHKLDTSVDASKVETDKKPGDISSVEQSPETGHESSVDHAPTNQDQVDSMTENVEAEQIGPLGHFSHVLSGSEQIDKGNKNVVEITEEVLREPVLKKVQQCDPEAFQHRGMRRRCLQFDGEGPKSLSLETPSTPVIGKPPDTMHPKGSLNSTTNIPKPSKIGLHLNSLFNPMHAGSGATIHLSQARRGSFSIQGKSSMTVMNSANEFVSARTDDTGSNLQTSLSTYIIKPSNKAIVLNPIEDQLTPGNKRSCDTENDEDAEELYKSSPKRKRKKTSESSGGDGCKHCNCKKTKCLKLYCDCFAAGIYCAEPCACQGCFNRPEYEDTVIDTRQQIESRNPLAFAPKVVQHIIEPPASSCGEEGVHFTPSSARHKRGCNCKKSMCLKKYCECYQANVGCSDGCRCEGCKNVYGQKGEYCMIKDVLSEEDANERTSASFVNNSKMVASGNVVCHTELCDPHNSTPVTPAFQFPNHEKDGSKAWLHSGKYLQSPESGLPFVAPYVISPGSPRNSDNNDSVSETTKEILDLVSFNQDSDYGNADAADEFSAVCHETGNLGLLSGLPNSEEWSSNSVAQSSSGNRLYSSASSLQWRSSPLTPMAHFSGTKLHQGVDFDHKLLNIVQDDTPEILKDTPTPDAVKVSSPNKKRVSPPHGPVQEFGSSSPGGLRSGFKFILKSVPSFPPLTPCIDSKSGTVQQTNDPQHCSGTVQQTNDPQHCSGTVNDQNC